MNLHSNLLQRQSRPNLTRANLKLFQNKRFHKHQHPHQPIRKVIMQSLMLLQFVNKWKTDNIIRKRKRNSSVLLSVCFCFIIILLFFRIYFFLVIFIFFFFYLLVFQCGFSNLRFLYLFQPTTFFAVFFPYYCVHI